MQLIQRRLQEFSLWDPSRFHTFKMNERFRLGPFEYAHLYGSDWQHAVHLVLLSVTSRGYS